MKSRLRKENPGKYVFSFMLAAPERGGAAVELEGVLNVRSTEEMMAVYRRLLAMVEGPLPKGEPEPGQVAVTKATGNS